MKKTIGIFSLVVLLFSTFTPSFTYANNDIDILAGLLQNAIDEEDIKLNNNNLVKNNLPENWKFGTITVARPDGLGDEDGPLSFTIMDRNLGASNAGIGKSSYGFHYQRGNNYGFSSTGDFSTSTTLVEWDSGYDNKGYYGEDFIITDNTSYWEDKKNHGGLWGGSGDVRGLSNIGETAGQRQGPCPEGWHIPSIGEWHALIRYFAISNNIGYSHSYGNITEDYAYFNNYFKLPFAGYRSSYADNQISSEDVFGYYWASTFKKNLYIGSSIVTAASTMASDSQGCSIRCFKNTSISPQKHLVSIIDGDDTLDSFSLNDGELLNRYLDFREMYKTGYVFLGRYNEETGEKIHPFDYIGKDTRIYAKYNKEYPVYSYNANGGIFDDGKISKNIESSLIVSEITTNNPNQNALVQNVVKLTGSVSLNLNIVVRRWCTNMVNIYDYDRTKNSDGDAIASISVPSTLNYFTGQYNIDGDVLTIETIGRGSCPSEPYTGLVKGYNYSNIITEIPSLSGYTFSGWYETGVLEPFDFTGTKITQDRVFYAKWNPHHYTIKFNVNGGAGTANDINATYGEKINLPNVTREGYVFKGWQSENGALYNIVPEGTGVTTEDGVTVTLTAQWDIIPPASGGGKTITPTKQDSKVTEQEHNSADLEKIGVEEVKSHQTTTSPTIKEQVKKVEGRSLTRGEIAVMTNILLDVYPQLTEKREFNEVSEACENFTDEQNFTKDEKKAITRLCKLSIMGIHADNNKPLDEFMVNEITKNDEFSKVINRSLESYTEKDLSVVKDALKKLENDKENVVFGTVYDVFMSIKNIFN